MSNVFAPLGPTYMVDGIQKNFPVASKEAQRTLGMRSPEELLRNGWGGPLHQLIHNPRVRDIIISHDSTSPSGKAVWVRDYSGKKSREPINITDQWIEELAYGWKYANHTIVPDKDPNTMFRHTAFFPGVGGGIRYQYVGPAMSPYGASIYIRRLPSTPVTLDELMGNHTISHEAVIVLRRIMAAGCSLIVSGQTGAGKTTMLGALIHDLQTRIDPLNLLIVEKSYEIPVIKPAYRWEETDKNSLVNLASNATQMGLEWLCLGESTGPEAYFVAKAFTQGVPVVTTLHASSPSDAVLQLGRLSLEYIRESAMMESMLRTFADQGIFSMHLDLKEREGGLLGQVVGIEECISVAGSRPVMNPVFRWDESQQKTVYNPGAISQLSAATKMRFNAAGVEFPSMAELNDLVAARNTAANNALQEIDDKKKPRFPWR